MIKLKHLIEENARMDQINAKIEHLYYNHYKKMPEGEAKEALKNKIDALGIEFDKVRDADEYEGDKHSFLKHHYTGHISSDSYSKYEKNGGLKWLGEPTKFPVLLTRGNFGGVEVEFRQRDEDVKYVSHDANGEIRRDSKGNPIYMTKDEMQSENLPMKDQTIVAFVNENPVGFASNEFGAVGVWVEKEFQRKGIGTELLDLHVQQRPNMMSGKGKFGQMTNAGISLTKKYYDRLHKRHGGNWFRKLKVSEND